MQRFLICSGMHGDANGIARLQRFATTSSPDGILFGPDEIVRDEVWKN